MLTRIIPEIKKIKNLSDVATVIVIVLEGFFENFKCPWEKIGWFPTNWAMKGPIRSRRVPLFKTRHLNIDLDSECANLENEVTEGHTRKLCSPNEMSNIIDFAIFIFMGMVRAKNKHKSSKFRTNTKGLSDLYIEYN